MQATAASRLQIELSRVPLEDYMCQVYAPKVAAVFKTHGIKVNVLRWTNRRSNYFADRMILFSMDTRFGRRQYDKHFNVMYLNTADDGCEEIRIWDGFMPDHLRDLSLEEYVLAGFVDPRPIRAQWSKPPAGGFVLPKSAFLAGAKLALKKDDKIGFSRFTEFLRMGSENGYWSYFDHEVAAEPRRAATGVRRIVR